MPVDHRSSATVSDQAKESGTIGAGVAEMPLRVLVVDDDVEVAAALSAFLSVTGIEAAAVHDVDTALARVAGDAGITVVVSDLRMPGKDGLQLSIELRDGTPEARAVEVVMITAHATSEVAFSAGRNSVFAFLQKPFRPQNLGKVVREAHAAAVTRRAKVASAVPAPVVEEALPAGSPVRVINAAIALSQVAPRPVSVVVDTGGAEIAVEADPLAAALAAVLVQANAAAERNAVITVTAGDAAENLTFDVAVVRAPYPTPEAAGGGNAAGLAHAAGGRLQMGSETGVEFRATIIVPGRPGGAGQG